MSRTLSRGETSAGHTVGVRELVPALGAVLLLYFVVPVLVLVIAQSPASLATDVTRRTSSPPPPPTPSSRRRSARWSPSPSAFPWPTGSRARRSATARDGCGDAPARPPAGRQRDVAVDRRRPAGLGGLTDVTLTRSLLGVIAAQTFVASPFFVVTAKAVFEALPTGSKKPHGRSDATGSGRCVR